MAVQILCSVLVEDNLVSLSITWNSSFFCCFCFLHMPGCVVFRYLAVKDMMLGNSCVLVV